MSTPIGDLVLERLYAREASLVNHLNGQDQKAGYILVAITFLAGQISSLLMKPKLGNWHWLLFCSGAALIVATFGVVMGTSFQTLLEERALDLTSWVREAKLNRYTEAEMRQQLQESTSQRLINNLRIFRVRSKFLEVGFWSVVIALLLNLGALLIASV